jgi:hypothetical protein
LNGILWVSQPAPLHHRFTEAGSRPREQLWRLHREHLRQAAHHRSQLMTLRAQITRLAQRIEDLAECTANRRQRKIAHITQDKDRGETEEETVVKYFA